MDIMDDDDERIVALKRTYEDAIMNISKEATARVMGSERKSQLLEDELREKKDEAVQIMLRLKTHMDDKVREAKITWQNQQKKIDELEAQLQEAEDIVSELRKELRYVQAKYERVIRNHEENRPQYNSHSLSCPLQSQKFSLIGSAKENSYLYQRTEYPKCPSQLIVMKNSYGNKPELPSIIRRSKKHMFYRNGFIQRIQSLIRNVDGELSPSRQPNSASIKGKEGEQTEKSTCNATIDGVDKMFNIGSKEGMHKDDSKEAMNLISGKGETIPKYTENESTIPKKNHHKLFMKINGTPIDPTCKSFRNRTEPNHDLTLITPKVSLNITGVPTEPEFTKTTKMKEDNDKGDIGTMINKAESPDDMSVPIVEEEEKNVDVLVSEQNLKKINEPEQYCELKSIDATSEGPSLPVDKRVAKSTSQRGRKRGTVSIAKGNMSAKNNTSLRKKARKNDSAEPKKSRFVSDPSSLSFYLYGR